MFNNLLKEDSAEIFTKFEQVFHGISWTPNYLRAISYMGRYHTSLLGSESFLETGVDFELSCIPEVAWHVPFHVLVEGLNYL